MAYHSVKFIQIFTRTQLTIPTWCFDRCNTLYDKDYAKTWIKHYESNDDVFRTEYLEPYLKTKLSTLPNDSKILDVGCGWGVVLNFIKQKSRYYGVDIVPEFLEYVKNKYKNSVDLLSLKRGNLPDNIDHMDNFFDVVICSMVLHTISDIQKSIKTIFSKLNNNGKLFIITFNDNSLDYMKSCFERIYEQNDKYIRGVFVLPSNLKIEVENYFHGEKNYEKEITKFGVFSKKSLGPIFVAYECTKFKWSDHQNPPEPLCGADINKNIR